MPAGGEINASITVVKNGHGLLNVQEILTIFWNDSQFVQEVCVEVDGVPSILTSVIRLPALALTGIVKLVDDVPRKLHRLSTATNAVDQAWVFNRRIIFDNQGVTPAVIWRGVKRQRHWIVRAILGPFDA